MKDVGFIWAERHLSFTNTNIRNFDYPLVSFISKLLNSNMCIQGKRSVKWIVTNVILKYARNIFRITKCFCKGLYICIIINFNSSQSSGRLLMASRWHVISIITWNRIKVYFLPTEKYKIENFFTTKILKETISRILYKFFLTFKLYQSWYPF